MNKTNLSRRGFIAGGATTLAATTLALSSRAQGTVLPLPEVDKPGRTPNTELAVNIEMWFRGPAVQRIHEAAELGFPGIEFWPFQNKNIDAMARALREHDMTAANFVAWPFGRELNNPEMGPDNFLKTIEESCIAAAKLPGCEMFTVVLGDNIEGLSKETMHQAAIEKLKQAVPILEKHDKMLLVEPMNPYNHPDHCLYGSADGIAICKAVGSERVKLNWDLFHMQRYEGNLIHNMRQGREYIGYMQIADSPSRNEPGTGEVNHTNIFKAMRDIGYTKPVGLECVPQDRDLRRAAQRTYAADTW